MRPNHPDHLLGIPLDSSDLTRRRFLLGMGAAAAGTVLIPSFAEAAWPERPITAVVMYAAGGGTDTMIRVLAKEMAAATGWTVNVINKPGAVGGVATRFLLNKPANGYWWLGAANYNKFVRVMGHSDSVAWQDWQYFQAGNSLACWSVRPSSKFKTFNDVVTYAKKNPGKLTLSTSGVGGLWHEVAAIVANAAGIELKYVPYKGGKPATLAGLQGEVDIAGGGVHEHIEFVKAGKLRMLQQTGAEDIHVPGGPTLPSIGNFIPGLKSSLPVGGIYNFALKRKTPVEILEQFKGAFLKACKSKAYLDICKRKYFQPDVRWGEPADRRAAQVEAITAATFLKLQKQIGKKVHGPKDLGLPDPKDFASWWPPKGYKPRMSSSSTS